jgi:hypothetical protein
MTRSAPNLFHAGRANSGMLPSTLPKRGSTIDLTNAISKARAAD